MTVAEQVISVFCGVKGHLDDIQQKDISPGMGWPQAKLGSMNDRGGASFPVSKAKYKVLGQVS